MIRKVLRKIISFLDQSNTWIVIFVVLGVIFAGVLYAIYLGDNLRYPDELDYHKIATNINFIHQFSLDSESSTAFRAPGYPFFLAFFLFWGANIIHLRIINFIILGLSIYLLNIIIKRQSSPLSGTIGALLVIGLPVLFYTAGALYPQTLASFLLLLILFLICGKNKSPWVFVLSGILLGYLILTIPIFLFLLLVFPVWYFYANKNFKWISITIIIPILIVGFWSVRNYKVFNSFVFISSNTGVNLLFGNSENTTPNAGVNVDISKYTSFANEAQLNEIEKDAYYQAEAIDFILANKIHSLKMYGLKFINHFNFRNELWTKSESTALRDYIMLITYGPLLLLFGLRLSLLKYLKLSKFEVLLINIYLVSALFYAVFFTRIRFRIPFEFLLIGIVAIFIPNILTYLRLMPEEGSSSG